MRLLLVFGLALFANPLFAQVPPLATGTAELKKLSIEQLMDIEVTSVSRSEESLSGAPAAVAVVTDEDLRRTGARDVPDGLRWVPGIQVAQQRASSWALSARGFNSTSSDKLLVLSDTRSIYTPLFSGVLWDAQDYLLHDIDRIEVVRGPGATLWGSNAVNGVINITTKSAQRTQGLYAEVTAGTEERAVASARYGGRIGSGYYRVFGRFVNRDSTAVPAGASVDDWSMGHVGFRTDWETASKDAFTLQGDAYRGDIGLISPSIAVAGRTSPQGRLRVDTSGGNMLARWRHRTGADGDLQLRIYFDRTHRNDPSFVDDLNTFDVDVQRRMLVASSQDITWGANYRFTGNTNTGKGIFAVDPPYSGDHLISGFVQDQIPITRAVDLTVGTKLEHNDFSGFEVQPSVRAVWEVRRRQTMWGAVSRAVRVPTRLERDISIDVSDPAARVRVRLQGNRDFDAEELVAYELGYRWRITEALFIDAAGFHNRYNGLASLEQGTPAVQPNGSIIVPIVNENLNDGRSTGLEIQATVDPTPWWRVSASSSSLRLTVEPGGRDLNRGRFLDGSSPRHQLAIRSSFDLSHNVQLDGMFRHVTALRRLPTSPTGEGVPAYADLDARIAWRAWTHAELALVGQNLLHAQHPEFGTAASRGEIERGVYATLSWGF